MTDRELLEAAARAAGLPMHRYCDAWKAMARYTLQDGYHGPSWDPLTDDGDALRLFTRLPFRNLYVSEVGVTVSWEREDGSGHGFKCDEYASENQGDLNAATRRAITRAAAAIGANKEQA